MAISATMLNAPNALEAVLLLPAIYRPEDTCFLVLGAETSN
jgi:hypothetical protein